jgi:hypothetical protein
MLRGVVEHRTVASAVTAAAVSLAGWWQLLWPDADPVRVIAFQRPAL